jgi:uncharacterized protein
VTRALIAAALVLGACGVLLLTVAGLRQAVLQRLPATWQITLQSLRHGIHVDHDVVIISADGTRLASSLYLPRGSRDSLPTVLIRVPYRRLSYAEGFSSALFFASHGYAVVVQDLRGTGDSQGELMPWEKSADDGEATLDWIARQRWSNGKVGTFGCSALGETQLMLAARNHPAHAAVIASGAGGAVGSIAGRYGYFGVFEGGVPQLASVFGWFVANGPKHPDAAPTSSFSTVEHLRHLPSAELLRRVRSAPDGFEEFLTTPFGDSKWSRWGYLSPSDKTKVPSLIINTWGDQTVGDSLALAEVWRQSGTPQKVVISAGKHCGHEEAGQNAKAKFGVLALENVDRPWREWYLRWFDRWIEGKSDALDDLAEYNVFMLVENRWYRASQWPPQQSKLQRWYLGSDGNARSLMGNGHLELAATGSALVDQFSYDPESPVPTRGGPACCTGDPANELGPMSQADVETRDDVLVYTSAHLPDDVRIIGPVKAHLSVSSSAPDTDLVVRLTHVWPNGESTNVQEGALRLRYRDAMERPSLLVPGARYVVTVDMRSIAYMIPRGHRLRLQVTSSSFPRLERNLNTGAAQNALESHPVVARNSIHYAPDGASWVEFPVIDAAVAASR